jgi:ferritin-like metal-binding protein YciE
MPESAQQTESGHSEEDEQAQDSEEQQSEGRSEDEGGESEEKDEGEDSEEKDEDKDPAEELLLSHLMEVHSLEEQGSKQLEGAIDLTEGDELEQVFQDHLEETREHEQVIRDRIEARDTKPSAIKDLTMQAASGVGLRYLGDHPADTPVKLAMHMFCFENLEIAAYEFLIRFAQAAGDDETAQAAEKILGEERDMAEKLCGSFDRVVELLGEYGGDEAEDEDEDEDSDGEDRDGDDDRDGGDEDES